MYYKIPFDFGALMAQEDGEQPLPIPTCSLYESIGQHLHTLIITRMGENRFDKEYGNSIWELEFSNGISDTQWNEHFSESVRVIVKAYEPRITGCKVTIHSELVEKTWPMRNYTEVKKKVTILIKAKITDTGEDYSFKTDLFLSPMSVD